MSLLQRANIGRLRLISVREQRVNDAFWTVALDGNSSRLLTYYIGQIAPALKCRNCGVVRSASVFERAPYYCNFTVLTLVASGVQFWY